MLLDYNVTSVKLVLLDCHMNQIPDALNVSALVEVVTVLTLV